MCKVYEFPMKKQLSKEVEERIYGLGRDYATALFEIVESVYDDIDTEADYDELMELTVAAYTQGVIDVVDEYEGS